MANAKSNNPGPRKPRRMAAVPMPYDKFTDQDREWRVTVGRNIIAARAHHGISQQALADLLGAAIGTVRAAELGTSVLSYTRAQVYIALMPTLTLGHLGYCDVPNVYTSPVEAGAGDS